MALGRLGVSTRLIHEGGRRWHGEHNNQGRDSPGRGIDEDVLDAKVGCARTPGRGRGKADRRAGFVARRFMDFVLVREDYQLAKPHPEPYLTGLKRLGATQEETLVVEDSSRGLNSAVAAGIECVIVYNRFTRAHDFSQAGYRIETLIELKEIILEVT
jgi:beta-phosphoglucomutase-like phosphatase (HAD superfamily)